MSQPDNEKVYDLGTACSLEDHRQCQFSTVVGMAADISEQEGLDLSPQLKVIMETKKLTESSMKSALREWVNTIPESQKEVAADLLNIAENG
ncbi:hypothetical protein ACE41H_15000 [Paenibacillus enshidis]|uniref:Uncharacterized protein n=1 Tax=Paenibacillus enshidis TaxID=1458439 RepID=A0ABV5AV49_9BACL